MEETSSDLFTVEGRTVLVTGAAGGLGRETVAAFLQRGAQVVACDVAAENLPQPRPGEPLLPLACDVTRAEQVIACVAQALERFGTIDVLVNNAGISAVEPALDLPLERWQAVLAVNLTGAFLVAREVGRHMVARGSGSIINIASIYGQVAPSLHPSSPYTASKSGLLGLTRALAAEWGRYGVRVNAVCPTYFASELSRRRLADPAMAAAVLDRSLLRIAAQPADLIGGILFLASDASRLVTGHALAIDGGWLAI